MLICGHDCDLHPVVSIHIMFGVSTQDFLNKYVPASHDALVIILSICLFHDNLASRLGGQVH